MGGQTTQLTREQRNKYQQIAGQLIDQLYKEYMPSIQGLPEETKAQILSKIEEQAREYAKAMIISEMGSY